MVAERGMEEWLGTPASTQGGLHFMYLYESTSGGVGWRSCISGKWGSPDVNPHFKVGSLDSSCLHMALELGPEALASSGSSGMPPDNVRMFLGEIG